MTCRYCQKPVEVEADRVKLGIGQTCNEPKCTDPAHYAPVEAHRRCHAFNRAIVATQGAIDAYDLLARSARAAGANLRDLNNAIWDLKELVEKEGDNAKQ